MAKLYIDVIKKEKADGTYQRYELKKDYKWGQNKD